MDLADCFKPSYAASRECLLASAHRLRTRHDVLVDSRAIDDRGPDGETLALDFVVFGARRPTHALVVSCGTHGVEGYTGSAVQHYLLERLLPDLRLDPQTAIVLQHANNPYGFAWHRRVNESNVDFNRNFAERFDATVCDPDYELLYDALNPASVEPDAERASRQRIDAYVAGHGLRRFQQVAVGGQYKYPDGIQYGGRRQEQGARHLLALVREHLAQARTVVWLDFHTGLGDFGDCELITGAAAGSDCHAFSNRVWPGSVKSAASGESVSTPLNGLLDRALESAMPAGCRFAFAYPEYGTYEPRRVIDAMRIDNWLHRYGDPTDAIGRRIKAEVLEAFRPADRDWQRRVVRTGAQLVEQALAAMPGVYRK
jgi:hypothetical protein